MDHNVDALIAMSALPYFPEIINNDANEAGWTPMLMACINSNQSDLTCIKLLSESGASLTHQKKANGMGPIHFAASNNDVHLLDYIIDTEGESIVAQENNEGWTPTDYACFLNNFDAVNLLMEKGANLSKTNQSGYSAFDQLVLADNVDLFECVWNQAKLVKRDMKKKASFGFIHLAAG